MMKEFPSNSDYDEIVEQLNKYISVDFIALGEPIPLSAYSFEAYSGGYSIVFPILVEDTKIALRFWTANINNIQHIYKEIDMYLKEKNLSYFANFHYIEDGLTWKNNTYPFIYMEWVDGLRLDEYIDRHITNSRKIKKLAEDFLKMVKALHQNNISHGDLQDGNILVVENGNDIELKLIDYDTLFVPSLKDYNIENTGVESYQHPKREEMKKLNHKMDYFSELVIYLSLLVYAEDSSLWEKEQTEKLLFDYKDFRNPLNSKIFKHLKNKKYSSDIYELTLILEEFCLKDNINDLLPLEEIIEDKFKDLIKSFSSNEEKEVSKFTKEEDDIFDNLINGM